MIHLAYTFPLCQTTFQLQQLMVFMHLHSFAMAVLLQIIVTFVTPQDPGNKILSQGYNVNRLLNIFKKFYGRHTDLVGQYKNNVCQMFADSFS